MSDLVKIICMAEAEGELAEPFYRKYWVHPVIGDRQSDKSFDIFFDN